MNKKVKVYITKHALTSGIVEREAELCNENMIVTVEKWPAYYHGKGKEWHLSHESAVKRAEEMRQKKIESLKKQMKKIENLKF